MRPLHRRYRYVREGRRVVLKAVPDYGLGATRFYAQTYRIANDLFNAGRAGGSLNAVCTAQGGGVIFQLTNAQLNLKRARQVTAIWRKQRREVIQSRPGRGRSRTDRGTPAEPLGKMILGHRRNARPEGRG